MTLTKIVQQPKNGVRLVVVEMVIRLQRVLRVRVILIKEYVTIPSSQGFRARIPKAYQTPSLDSGRTATRENDVRMFIM